MNRVAAEGASPAACDVGLQASLYPFLVLNSAASLVQGGLPFPRTPRARQLSRGRLEGEAQALATSARALEPADGGRTWRDTMLAKLAMSRVVFLATVVLVACGAGRHTGEGAGRASRSLTSPSRDNGIR